MVRSLYFKIAIGGSVGELQYSNFFSYFNEPPTDDRRNGSNLRCIYFVAALRAPLEHLKERRSITPPWYTAVMEYYAGDIAIQERDLALLLTMFESRVLTPAHAAIIHFGGSKEATKKRLQKLKAAGFISERARRVSEQSVLSLTPKAFSILKERGLLSVYPELSQRAMERRAQVSPATLAHELKVMDVKTSFYSALKNNRRYAITEFTTWPLLNQFLTTERGGTLVKPDGFIRIRENQADGVVLEECFFLEVDRSTETLDRLISRAVSYLDYYRSGGFALRNGGTRFDVREYPFRVLVVVNPAERRNNIAERLVQTTPPILTMVCLAVLADVLRDPMAPIWLTPRDYREITKDSPYDVSRFNRVCRFKRQRSRDSFIEENIQMSHLVKG